MFLMNDGNLALDSTSTSNKSFLAREIKRLILEHRAALETLASHKPLMKIYRKKLEDLQ